MDSVPFHKAIFVTVPLFTTSIFPLVPPQLDLNHT